ncbi:MAG: SseB family protein [Bdellovibrionales bacterium]|nr:SseB family protein [Bdellovibrionales bacterium]
MTSSADLQRCLRRVARGESEYLEQLLVLLSNSLLFVPVRSANEFAGSDTQRLRIPSFSRGNTKVLPVFVTEEALILWSGDYQCIGLLGADVALSAPEEVWLVVNPGQVTEVELSPSEVAKMARMDSPEPNRTVPISDALASASNDFGSVGNAIPDPSTVDVDKVLTDLRTLLSTYEEVSEGFFEMIGGAYSFAILGVLREEMDSERRFNMMAEIAELSRRYFGIAGGIEVYDDLHIARSNSWELFQALTPFFAAKEDAPTQPKGALLRSKIEKVADKASEPERAAAIPEQAKVLPLGGKRSPKDV